MVILPQGGGDSRGEEVTVESAEVVPVPGPPPRLSTPVEIRRKMPTKPISEQEVSVEHMQGGPTSESNKVERLPVAELLAANDSRLAEADPPVAACGDHEVEPEVEVEEAVVTNAPVSHIDNNPTRFPLTQAFRSGLT